MVQLLRENRVAIKPNGSQNKVQECLLIVSMERKAKQNKNIPGISTSSYGKEQSGKTRW